MRRVWVSLQNNNINHQYEIDNTNNKISVSFDSTQKDISINVGIYNIYRLAEEIEKTGIVASVGELKNDENKRFLVLSFNDSFTLLTGSLINFLGGIESVDSGDRINITDLR